MWEYYTGHEVEASMGGGRGTSVDFGDTIYLNEAHRHTRKHSFGRLRVVLMDMQATAPYRRPYV